MPVDKLKGLTHAFMLRVFGEDSHGTRSALQVTPQLPALGLIAVADDLKDSAAWLAIDAAKSAWVERLPDQKGDWLGWLISLPQADLLDLLALCAASTLNASPNAGTAFSANALADAVGLDMADWWTPTAGGYLSYVPKAQIIQVLNDAEAYPSEGGVGDMKKERLVVKAALWLAGKRWLPSVLRTRSAPEQ